jgi:hypothetical protein
MSCIVYRVQQQLLWLLDLLVTHPKSKTFVHISEKCVNFIGDCVRIRLEKIDKAGLSVKVASYICMHRIHDQQLYIFNYYVHHLCLVVQSKHFNK